MALSLKTSIKLVFLFENEINYYILGLIAKKGGLVENQIVNHLAGGTRRKVNGALQKFLVPNGFLYEKTPKKSRRNIKNAFGKGITVRPKEYYLTFKGLLASLAVTKFEENYLVIMHKKLISRWLNNYNIPEIAIQLIKYNLELFLLKNLIEGYNLTVINNIEAQIATMNAGIFSDHKFPLGDKKFYEIAISIHTNFRVYSQVLNQLLRKVLAELIEKRKRSKGNIIDGGGYLPSVDRLPHYIGNLYNMFVRYWYSTIVRNQFQDESKFKPFLIGEEFRQQRVFPLKIDNSEVNTSAKEILKKYRIKTDFELSQEPKFFTDS